MGRREITQGLVKATNSYLLKKGFAVYNEMAVVKWGRRRVDVIALNLRGEIVVGEVKSSPEDYYSDSKWMTYLEHCNRMHFVFTESVFSKLKAEIAPVLKQHGVGALLLSPTTGYLYSVLPARRRPMCGTNKKALVFRMAWRNADVSKRTNRRVRIFLDQD